MNPVEFIRKYCGLKLRDFQVEWLEELFREKNGERAYTQALWGLPRGNGKTEIAAAIALYMLVADRKRAEVYIAAGSRDQASLAFKAARRMVEQGKLGRIVRVLPGYRRMEVPRTDSTLHVISADGPLQHGLQPTCVIFDELWVQKKRDLFEALAGGLFKRENSLLVCISTAGYDQESLLAQECKRGEAGEDPRFFYQWHSAPEDAAHDDPETWKAANPALRCKKPFMRLKGLEDDLRRMHENEFRRWHLNQWTASEASWITAPAWDACDGKPQLVPNHPTILGVDASIRRDASVVATVQKHGSDYHAEFRVWEPDGSHDIELREIEDFIREQGKRFNLVAVAYDQQFMHYVAQKLESEGLPMVEWPQNNAHMCPATHTLHEVVMSGNLRHGGHPIARKHALAATVVETERGLRIKKTAARAPDDAAVALAMAVGEAAHDAPEKRSVYESRGLVAA